MRRRLVAQVPQRYLPALSRVYTANIIAPDGELLSLAALDGRLLSVGRSLETASTMVPVTFEFDSYPTVIPGAVVEVILLGAEREGVLTVPVGAITESQGARFVYEQVGEDEYVRHKVVTGASDGERIEILSGIGAGSSIVTRGAVHVKMAAATAIPHSHQH